MVNLLKFREKAAYPDGRDAEIVEYPSSKALLSIASSPGFQEIEVHRHAGLEGQLNIACSERPF
jgi:hypothetical protein